MMTTRTSGDEDRFWPIHHPDDAPHRATTPAQRLRSRGAVSWFVGAVVSLVWLIRPAQTVLQEASSPASAALGIGVVVVFGLAFLLSAPLQWGLPGGSRLLISAVVLVISLALIPWLGVAVPDVWTYVGVSVGLAALPWSITLPVITALSVLALILEGIGEGWTEDVLSVPVVIFSISMMMAAFAQVQATMNRLRAAQRQVEDLAAERERGRIARDIHDILGHSLTVVTVKSELAGRLVGLDPARAKRELSEIEALARGALSDVRATVAGSRGVTVSGELAAARAALEAAGIRADLPTSTDDVPEDRRELIGWIVREGVTNVVRHAAASVCRVRLDARGIEIADDGVGSSGAGGRSSTGLAGLRERVESSGGRMWVGRSDLGGFSLRVAL